MDWLGWILGVYHGRTGSSNHAICLMTREWAKWLAIYCIRRGLLNCVILVSSGMNLGCWDPLEFVHIPVMFKKIFRKSACFFSEKDISGSKVLIHNNLCGVWPLQFHIVGVNIKIKLIDKGLQLQAIYMHTHIHEYTWMPLLILISLFIYK